MQPNNTKIGNGLVHLIRMGKYIGHKRVQTFKSNWTFHLN